MAEEAESLKEANGEHRLFEKSFGLFRQALSLVPHEARLHVEFGRALYKARRWGAATNELFDAFGESLAMEDQVARWVNLLAVHCRRAQKPPNGSKVWKEADLRRIRFAFRKALETAAPPEELLLAARGGAIYEREKELHLKALKSFDDVFVEIGSAPAVSMHEDYVADLKSAVSFLKALLNGSEGLVASVRLKEAWDWLVLQRDVFIACRTLDESPKEAASVLSEAIRKFEKLGADSDEERDRFAHDLGEGYRTHIRHQGLRALLARAKLLAAEGNHQSKEIPNALVEARLAVGEAPERPGPHWISAEIFASLNDSDQAKEEIETAFRLGSVSEVLSHEHIVCKLAKCNLRAAEEASSPERRRALLEYSVRSFERVLSLFESEPFTSDQQTAKSRLVLHAAAHFWVGRFQCELRNCQDGVHHLKIARSMDYRPIEAQIWIGHAYSEAGVLDQAEAAFTEAIQMIPEDSGDSEPREAEACFGLALVCADRGGLVEAREHLDRFDQSDARGWPPALASLAADARGWISFLEGTDGDGTAIKELESAVKNGACARTWIHLATALLDGLPEPEPERGLRLARIRQSCEAAERADLRRLHARKIADLQQSLALAERAFR